VLLLGVSGVVVVVPGEETFRLLGVEAVVVAALGLVLPLFPFLGLLPTAAAGCGTGLGRAAGGAEP